MRVAGPVGEFAGTSELSDRDGLPGAGWTGHEAGTDRMPVEQDEPTAAGHGVTDGGGRDHQQPGMMLQPDSS